MCNGVKICRKMLRQYGQQICVQKEIVVYYFSTNNENIIKKAVLKGENI